MTKRGPGRWQRQILAALNSHVAVFARDLLPLEPTRAQQAALGRAIRDLHDNGKIGLARWWGRNPAGGRVVVFRAGKLAPPAHAIARLECKGDEAPMQHLPKLHSRRDRTIFVNTV